MAKSKSKTIKKNQIKISKKCKDLNKLKQLKINENIRKLYKRIIVQKDLQVIE